jgi:hypothetical protein
VRHDRPSALRDPFNQEPTASGPEGIQGNPQRVCPNLPIRSNEGRCLLRFEICNEAIWGLGYEFECRCISNPTYAQAVTSDKREAQTNGAALFVMKSARKKNAKAA